VPIASISLADQQPLVDLVDKILAEYATLGHPLLADAAARVASWEQEIDAQVYAIYGITPDDVESIAAVATTNLGDEDADDDALDDE